MKRIFGDLPREAIVLTWVAFIVAVGFGLIIPAIPVFSRSFGVNNTQVGFVISAFGIVRFITGPLSGRLVERFGERLILSIGMFITAISSAVAGLAHSYSELLIYRSAGGLGSTMFTVSASSLLFRTVPHHQHGRAQSIYQGGFLLGGIAGPAFGGALLAISYRAPFFAYALSLAVAGLVSAIFLAQSRLGAAASSNDEESTSFRDAITMQPYVTALMCSFGAGWAIFGTRNSITPLFVTEGLHESATWAGLGFAISAIAQASVLMIAGKHADRSGRRSALLIGVLLGIAGLLIIAVAPNVAVFMIGMAVAGFGGAFFGAPSAALVADIVKGKAGKVVAGYQMSSDLGFILGPLVAGFLVDTVSFHAAFIVGAIILLPALVLISRLADTRRVVVFTPDT